MAWKAIVERWQKVESYGKEHPVLVTVIVLIITAASSSLSPLFKGVLLQILALTIRNWIEFLLVAWLIVLTIAVSRMRTAILYFKPKESVRDKSGLGFSPDEFLHDLTLIDGIILISCCEKTGHMWVSETLKDVQSALKGTEVCPSEGELLNRLYLLDKRGVLHLSMDSGLPRVY